MNKLTAILLATISLATTEQLLDETERDWSGDLAAFRQQNLDCHNKYRALHQVGPVSYTDELNTYALNYAKQMAASGLFQHSGGPYGENLFGTTGSLDGNNACNAWYSENKNYDYTQDNPPNFMSVGHFTQLVWKGTTQIGYGIAKNDSSKWTYVVGSYKPPGNYKNQYKANVFPPKS